MKPAAVAATGAGAALIVHAAPALTFVGPLRARLLPALAGVGDPDHVALTFDDGPDPHSTPAVLAALADLDWHATFFMLGSQVRAAPGLAAEVAAAGHEVAVHGTEHRSQLFRAPWSVVADVERGRDLVQDATGRVPRWFRPPYGTLSAGSLLAARRLGLATVLWTAWGRDWRPEATPESIVADVDRDLHPGATVLLHDSDYTSAPGSWRATVAALPLLAERCAARGLKVGPLADHGIAAAR